MVAEEGSAAFGVRRLVGAFRLADLSASKGAFSARCPANRPRIVEFDGEKSPRESGDKSPHSPQSANRHYGVRRLVGAFRLADLSASKGAFSARCPANRPCIVEFDGDKSPRKSGDKSPHSTSPQPCGGSSNGHSLIQRCAFISNRGSVPGATAATGTRKFIADSKATSSWRASASASSKPGRGSTFTLS